MFTVHGSQQNGSVLPALEPHLRVTDGAANTCARLDVLNTCTFFLPFKMASKAVTTRPLPILKGFLKTLLCNCFPMMNKCQVEKIRTRNLCCLTCAQLSCLTKRKSGILSCRGGTDSDGDVRGASLLFRLLALHRLSQTRQLHPEAALM